MYIMEGKEGRHVHYIPPRNGNVAKVARRNSPPAKIVWPTRLAYIMEGKEKQFGDQLTLYHYEVMGGKNRH